MKRGLQGWLSASVIGLALFAAGSVLADDSVAAHCPTYTSHLLRAKALLSRGDQKGAVEELQSAREALSACIRQEADQASDGTLLG